jgi:hypothetical protein
MAISIDRSNRSFGPPSDQQASHRHAVPDRPRGFPTADPGSDFLAASHGGWGDEPVTRWGMGR